ncbi:Signal peptide peptidase [Lachnellula willkommii]|uniref:Signal peptide peptidase n=1 Tax=Lachnellula willkommii TaxID=215461 RepID=A0A559M0A5_9HELO|nr:Signal peptide peptidase [Lachnellula willkommii]
MSNFFQGDSPALQYIGSWTASAWDNRDMYQMQLHLLLASLFPIYIGAHAALRRPPSALPPRKEPSTDAEDDEIDLEPAIEGLQPSDAIMFPVLASITLGGLYLLIKWLNDPSLLNKIMTWYFSALGVFGVGKLAGDSLHVMSTIIFPSVWSDGKQLYYVKPDFQIQATGESTSSQPLRTVTDKKNPLPSFFSSIPFADAINTKLWSARALLKNHWIFRGYLHGLLNTKLRVTFHDVAGLALGLAAIIAYNTSGKAWWLTNLMGFGFCYGAFQIMSPTTFWTGSLVLTGLFVYDIIMVFYTPMMVTVATTLDVPIKLVFPGPKRGGMLGLGDVVLPGIMMALALRFDLYLHYVRKHFKQGKRALYVETTGLWGERFWTSSSKEKNVADAARFPKTYFKASVVGYVVGMLTTLVVLNSFNHAQPALLYLVPGVLVSLWGTAWVRGEIQLMWGYTEDGSLDVREAVGREELSKEEVEKKAEERENRRSKEHAHHVFLFSLSDPKHDLPRAKVLDGAKEE